MLDELRETYDFVVVDTPPLLAVTDPSAVAAHVDGVILVVKITKKAKPHALRAREVLDLIGARILGVVVNGVDDEGYAGRSYSYAYAGRYRYSGSSGGYDGSYGDDYFQRGKSAGAASSHQPAR
jgi:Mrp family chromosome partitioning ATPase